MLCLAAVSFCGAVDVFGQGAQGRLCFGG